ncbi:MAG: hypothetical protein RIS47_1382 [Bacteroidota bacterium]|jgi:NAD(P)-dependent dehydrogenase (short-subunit alcohol dehydrogenase family)
MQRTILITGANRGIGYETAKQLAAARHIVLLTARNMAAAEAAAEAIPGEVIPYKLDLNDPQSSWQLAELVQQNHGRIDSLIHNAGIFTPTQITQLTTTEIATVFQTNIFGIIQTTNNLLPLLRASTDARIIHLSSGMGANESLSQGDSAAYRLSKNLLNAYTQMLASELRPQRISVNAVCPGWVQTDMGGTDAPRTPAQGADTVVWLATDAPKSTGSFFRDRSPIAW